MSMLRNKRVRWCFVAIPVSGLLVLSFWVGIISYRYDLPFQNAGRQVVRHLALSAIAAGVSIYDPYEAQMQTVLLGPAIKESEKKIQGMSSFFEQWSRELGFSDIKIKNEKIIQSSYSFYYQPFVPRLQELRNRFELDNVVSGSQDELEEIIRLRQWTRKQFSRSDYQKIMDPFDAVAILDMQHKNRDNQPWHTDEYRPCNFFPLFYAQVLLSMGHIPRLVHISYVGKEDKDYHGFLEVWSNQYGKWISMDPDLNLHYMRNGIPLNMLELHEANYQSGLNQIEIKQLIVEPGKQPEVTVEDMIHYHSYVEIAALRNDWLTNIYFKGHPARSDKSTLSWNDSRQKANWKLTPVTFNKDDFYWTLNQTEIIINPENSNQQQLNLLFHTVTPNFSHFNVKVNGKVSKLHEGGFTWDLRKGLNGFEVVSVNKFGVKGIISQVRFYIK